MKLRTQDKNALQTCARAGGLLSQRLPIVSEALTMLEPNIVRCEAVVQDGCINQAVDMTQEAKMNSCREGWVDRARP